MAGEKSSYSCLSIPRSTFPSNWTLGLEIQGHLENGPKINCPVSLQEGKGLAAVVVHDDLVATPGVEAISSQLSALSSQLSALSNQLSVGNTPPPRSEIGHLQSRDYFSELKIESNDCDEAILLALNEQLFASIH
jgi:hypothetical protein